MVAVLQETIRARCFATNGADGTKKGLTGEVLVRWGNIVCGRLLLSFGNVAVLGLCSLVGVRKRHRSDGRASKISQMSVRLR